MHKSWSHSCGEYKMLTSLKLRVEWELPKAVEQDVTSVSQWEQLGTAMFSVHTRVTTNAKVLSLSKS